MKKRKMGGNILVSDFLGEKPSSRERIAREKASVVTVCGGIWGLRKARVARQSYEAEPKHELFSLMVPNPISYTCE